MTLKVLVTGAGALLGQGIIRSMQMSSLDAEIVTTDTSAMAAGLYWGVRGYLVPFIKDPRCWDRMQEIVALERPDAILIGTDIELPMFAERREALERDHATHVLVSSSKVVEIADDKYLTYRFFNDAGFDCPQSCLPEDREALIERAGFPLIVKPRIGARSVGVSIVRNREELEQAIAGRQGLVLQECVGDDSVEYTAGALVFDGKCDATIVMRRDLRDGNTFRAYVDDFPELNTMVARWAAALGPYGPVNFQFRLDHDNKPKVFEINGRFSGTTPLRALAGFNEVELCLRAMLYGSPIVQPAVERMTILRHWSETIARPDQIAALR